MKWDVFTKLKCMWLLGCNRTLREVSRVLYMEGVYQRERQFEFSKETDIIRIEQVDLLTELYQVKRTVVKEYLFNPAPATQTHENEEWYAVYNAATRQLVELNHGRECSFHPVKQMMLLGNNAYQKIAKA
ncbi:hypothetical protein FRZ67_18915 [Panacibacter ginsenosidivorans]|uniref:Uncharacterized protein n=1 Tax=Panacibacter ginsenosidivorans TaxID=1813871 RepID=A0A5B8VCT1_9BACT|nr:hypothetical protein [Panacibacter ginsenosidivorans]QEC69280.1 hypothetical protein FRZ67_18915 [Panacibacter ginsenosidivorans]